MRSGKNQSIARFHRPCSELHDMKLIDFFMFCDSVHFIQESLISQFFTNREFKDWRKLIQILNRASLAGVACNAAVPSKTALSVRALIFFSWNICIAVIGQCLAKIRVWPVKSSLWRSTSSKKKSETFLLGHLHRSICLSLAVISYKNSRNVY